MKYFSSLLLLLIGLTSITALHAAEAPARIPVKVVVIAMYEGGEDTGDAPGELQHWVERDHLDRVYPLPAGFHPARMNDQGEMAILTGQGSTHAAATLMALGLDPRFDFSRTYWIVAGIAGGTPERGSLGSAFWARWVVDSDLAFAIDGREIPADWQTGIVPLRKTLPYEEPAAPMEGQVFALNPSLTEWAFQLTRNTPLPDSEEMKAARAKFDGASAQRPPFVGIGDEISGSTYWHGRLFDTWAARWVDYFTQGKGVFTTTAMEDTGTLQSLTWLARAGRVDSNRVLVLRTISNYDQQARGMTAADSLDKHRAGKTGAFLPALESAYTVGHVVVQELLSHWTQYEQKTPAAAK